MGLEVNKQPRSNHTFSTIDGEPHSNMLQLPDDVNQFTSHIDIFDIFVMSSRNLNNDNGPQS